MKGLRALEAAVIRLEGIVAVGLVLTMLALAGYNVFYRNVLVRLQKHWAHSGPPITAVVVEESPKPTAEGGPTPPPTKGAGEGFAGDWGEDDDGAPAADTEAEEAANAEAPKPAGEGFAGDWGEDEGGEPEPETKADEKGHAKAAVEPESDDLGDDDQFENLAMIDRAGEAKEEDGEPLGGPPSEGSFAANMVAIIDRIKLPWIDVVLRQMVILVSFFGAMMATQRSKHINVDALSKLLDRRWRRWLAVATNALAVYVCVVLAQAGADLVAISQEHPNRIVPWADDWVFQTMFPIGFGLVAFHFAVRLVEALANELPEDTQPEGGA
jgi:TRAP-type C4-dicarboxylate transport system permease small subunit